MMPQFDAFGELLKLAAAAATITGAMAWWRKGSQEEDETISAAADTLIEGVLDADKTNKIDLHTGKNIRDQLTIEQLEDMDKERTLRRFGRRN